MACIGLHVLYCASMVLSRLITLKALAKPQEWSYLEEKKSMQFTDFFLVLSAIEDIPKSNLLGAAMSEIMSQWTWQLQDLALEGGLQWVQCLSRQMLQCAAVLNLGWSSGHCATLSFLGQIRLFWNVLGPFVGCTSHYNILRKHVGVSQWLLPRAVRNNIKTKLPIFLLHLQPINQVCTFYPAEVYFGNQPRACSNI